MPPRREIVGWSMCEHYMQKVENRKQQVYWILMYLNNYYLRKHATWLIKVKALEISNYTSLEKPNGHCLSRLIDIMPGLR
jgi:hypothetical protein